MATTIIELKDTYPLLYEKAIEYQLRQRGQIDVTQNVDRAFTWTETEEPAYFWMDIYYGKFNSAKKTCPELFVEVQKDLTIKNNGLWTG